MGKKIWVIDDDPEPLVSLVPLQSAAERMARVGNSRTSEKSRQGSGKKQTRFAPKPAPAVKPANPNTATKDAEAAKAAAAADTEPAAEPASPAAETATPSTPPTQATETEETSAPAAAADAAANAAPPPEALAEELEEPEAEIAAPTPVVAEPAADLKAAAPTVTTPAAAPTAAGKDTAPAATTAAAKAPQPARPRKTRSAFWKQRAVLVDTETPALEEIAASSPLPQFESAGVTPPETSTSWDATAAAPEGIAVSPPAQSLEIEWASAERPESRDATAKPELMPPSAPLAATPIAGDSVAPVDATPAATNAASAPVEVTPAPEEPAPEPVDALPAEETACESGDAASESMETVPEHVDVASDLVDTDVASDLVDTDVAPDSVDAAPEADASAAATMVETVSAPISAAKPAAVPAMPGPTADEILASLLVNRSHRDESVVPLGSEIRPQVRNRPPPLQPLQAVPAAAVQPAKQRSGSLPAPLTSPGSSPSTRSEEVTPLVLAPIAVPVATTIEAPIARPKIVPSRPSKPQRGPTWGGTAGVEHYRRRSVGPLCQVLLAYLTGPLAVVVTSRGRRSMPWVFLSIFATVAWLGVNTWENLIFRLRDPAFVVAGWIAATVLATLVGFTTWAWGIRLVGQLVEQTYTKFPRRIRDPRAVVALGMLVPGLGLLITGRRRSSAFALWLAGLFILGAMILTRARWLWTLNFQSHRAGLPGGFLERVFLGAAALTAIGALFWVVQALEGMRRAEAGRVSGGSRAAWTAAALVVILVVSCFVFRPARMASNLDQQAFALQETGYRIIPIVMTRVAARLDPSRPEYAIHTVELYRMAGQPERAERARADLDRRMSPYMNVLRREGAPGNHP